MNKILREGVDTRVALDSELRQLAARERASGLGKTEDLSASAFSPPPQDTSAGLDLVRPSFKGILRSVAVRLYSLVRPIVRPLAYRFRGFLLLGMRDVLAEVVRNVSIESASRSPDSTVRALARANAESQEALRLSAEATARGLDDLARRLVPQVERNEEHIRALQTGTGEIQHRLTELRAMANRIESYSLASAGRIAVPCEPGEILVRTAVGFVLCPSSDHALLAILMENGELEQGVRHLIQRVLGPGDVFVDIGANVGMHTIAAARALKGEGRIFAFEPFEATARLLERTIWLNGFSELAQVHRRAVSNTSGERNLFLGQTSGHHSLYPLAEQGGADDSTMVRCVRLDEALPAELSIDLIKIDVEGAELEVLASAEALLAANPQLAIIAEFAPSHLRRAGGKPLDWLNEFERRGFVRGVIDESTGRLHDWSVEQIGATDSVNLFFSRAGSRAWERAHV